MSLSGTFITWLGQKAERCLIAEVGVKSGGSEITRYLSSRGFKSAGSDTPANTPYRPYIKACQFTRQLDLTGSGASMSSGVIDLENRTGALDGWLSDIWAGRTINLYLGARTWNKSQFELVMTGTIEDIAPKSRTELTLKLRDVFFPLNSTLSTATVGGTGDNKDALRPICLGECFNVTPVLLDAATQKYAVHLNEQIESVIEVRDNCIAVSATTTAASGYFTLTNARYGQITCDVQGKKVSTDWRNDVGGLVEWVATVVGDGNFLTGGQIDSTRLATFRAANTQPVGLYIDGRANRLAVLQQLAATLGASVVPTYDGKLFLAQIGFGTPTRTIDESQMIDGTFEPVERFDTKGAIRLTGERNWTPMTPANIAGSVTQAQVPIFTDESVTLAATDSTVLSDWHQDAKPTPADTLMVVESDISAECTRRLNLWKTPRTKYTFVGTAVCFQDEIGDTITLVHSRFGLSGGVSAQIVGITHDWINCRVRLEVLV